MSAWSAIAIMLIGIALGYWLGVNDVYDPNND